MSDTNPEVAVVVDNPKQKRKPTGRPRGSVGARKRHVYTPAEKSVALAIVDFFEGDMDRAARILGINHHTVRGWRQEVTAGQPTDYAKQDASLNGVMQKFTRYLDVVCALTLMKAEKASMSQMHGLVDVVGNKLIAVHALVEKRSSPIPAVPVVEPESAPEAVPADVGPVLDEAERQRWESIVETIMTESHVSRTAAIKSLVADKPEAKPYFKPTPAVTEEDEGMVN